MVTLFDQEQVQAIHEYNVAKNARSEGREEGREETILESIKNLMETLSLTFDQAIAALKISEADRPKYLEALETDRLNV